MSPACISATTLHTGLPPRCAVSRIRMSVPLGVRYSISTMNHSGVPESENRSAAREHGFDKAVALPTVSVVIAAFTMDRWELLHRSIDSVARQSHLPDQLILCIDSNPDMYEKCIEEWKAPLEPSGLRVDVMTDTTNQVSPGTGSTAPSARRFGAGAARTAAAFQATGDVVAYLDDDAEATQDWLQNLLEP